MNSRLSILLVDDDVDLCQSLGDILETRGFAADFAHSGKTALLACADKDYDAVIVDLRLPDIGGLELLPEIEELLPETKLLVITAYASTMNIATAVRRSTVGFLQKPVDNDRLLSILERVAKNRRLGLDNKILQESIHTAKLEWENTFDAITNPIAIVATDGVILRVNESFCKRFEISKEGACGRNDFELIFAGNRNESEMLGRHAAVRGESLQIEESQLAIPGIFQVSSFPVEFEIGAVVYYIEDVTERERVNRELTDSESRLQLALDAMDGGVWDWNIASGDVHFSPSWPKMLGYEPDEIESRIETWTGALHPDDRAVVMQKLDDHFEGKTRYSSEHRMRTKSGDWIWVLDRGQVVEWDKNGDPARMSGSDVNINDRVQDEEQRRKLEVKIQQTQKLESLAVLAGGIAHDFNNLLTGVMGSSELAALSLESSSPAQDHLARVGDLVTRAADLCQQLLAYSGRGKYEVKSFMLSELVHEMIDLLAVSISKKVTLKVDSDTDLLPVEADVNQIRQIVMNLIINASEALGDESGTISIRTRMAAPSADLSIRTFGEIAPDGNNVCFEVSDTGCGMDEETIGKIFDPFFTTKLTGRGLGLAAVLGIVANHHGMIELTSQPERGTVFRVFLPSSERPHEMLSTDKPIVDDWRGEGTVLVADDHESVLAIAGSILERRGFVVHVAHDGREALDVFKAHADEIVAVVLDLKMPRMGGVECLRELRILRPELPAVLSSGYDEQEVDSELRDSDVTVFIGKPYRQADLVAAVRSMVEA